MAKLSNYILIIGLVVTFITPAYLIVVFVSPEIGIKLSIEFLMLHWLVAPGLLYLTPIGVIVTLIGLTLNVIFKTDQD